MTPYPNGTMRIGLGYDVHAFASGRDLWLGGIKVPHEKGLQGHSDADVVIHALCDALLGAVAMRDIGYHFPDTKGNEFEGIDSKILLRRVVDMLHKAKYELVNCDITIMAQTPKLSPHIEAMRQCLAVTMGVDVAQISVKATTTERLGFVGREEGIAAEAVVLVQKKKQTCWKKLFRCLSTLLLPALLMGYSLSASCDVPEETAITITRDTLRFGTDSAMVIETACAPICSSIVQVFDNNWKLLRTVPAPSPSAVFPEAYIEDGQIKWRDNTPTD